MTQRRVLIVGGAGYVGCPLSSYLLAQGYRVRCLDALIYGQHAAVMGLVGDPHYEFVRGDLRDTRICEAALRDVTDVVILAGLVGDPVCKANPAYAQSVNERGLRSFIDLLDLRGLRKVVFASTCSNYGQVDGIANEETPLKPLGPYAVAKVNRELQLLKADADYCPVVLRFATAFGLAARMRFDLTLSEFVRTLWAGEVLEVYEGDTWRPYVHVRDMARAIAFVLHSDDNLVAGQVFNVGSDEANYTKQMLVDLIKPLVPCTEHVIKYKLVANDDRRDYRVSFKKVRDRLGFVTTRTVKDGIRELVRALNDGFYGSADPRLPFYRNDCGFIS